MWTKKKLKNEIQALKNQHNWFNFGGIIIRREDINRIELLDAESGFVVDPNPELDLRDKSVNDPRVNIYFNTPSGEVVQEIIFPELIDWEEFKKTIAKEFNLAVYYSKPNAERENLTLTKKVSIAKRENGSTYIKEEYQIQEQGKKNNEKK